MKEGWKNIKLGELCDLQNGFAFKSKDYIEASNTVNFRMSQIRPGGTVDLDNNPKYLPDEYANIYKNYLLKEGDIVIAMTDMATETKILGVPTIIPTDSRNWLLNQRVGKFFNIDKTKIYTEYLKHILVSESINDYYKSLGRGGLQINIGKQDILNAVIPLPPLPEQQRIISILDHCFEAIDKAKANAEQNLQNARELFESYLQGVFEKKGEGWEEKHLSEIALEFGRGKSKHRPRNWKGLFDGNYPFIQTGDVRNSRKYVTQYSQTYNEVGLAQSKLWDKGTICITIAANIAETAILDFDACFPDSIIGLQVDPKKADLDFTYYLLQYFKAELQKLGKGSAQDNINLGTFQYKSFPFPKSIKQQKDIVNHLDTLHAETQKLEIFYQKKLSYLEELKKSILQKAFAGELKTEKMVEEITTG